MALTLLIDTDCGVLGDDGTTIAMLARSRAVKINSITTVSGNVWNTSATKYTKEILALLGRPGIPVYTGATMPLRFTPAMAEEVHQKWGPIEFRGAFAEERPKARVTETAVDHIIRTIRENPGKITVVALGPLTNIAQALEKAPDIASKMESLVMMGGALRVPGNSSKTAEFNFWFDPEAASAVLKAPIPSKTMFGLDVCNKVMLNKQAFDEIVKTRTPLTERFKEDFGDRYPGFHKKPDATVSLWDSLVSAWLIDPKLFARPESLALDVVTEFGPDYGRVVERPGAAPTRMMNDVDAAKVLALFTKLLKAK